VSKSISQLVDELPTSNLTVSMLNALDFAAPGEWRNTVGFINTIKSMTGETDEKLIQQIGERAIYLFNDPSKGYQSALWLYQTVDSANKASATKFLANNRVSTQIATFQSLDLLLKVVVEVIAFCKIEGFPINSINSIELFAKSLSSSGASVNRKTGKLDFYETIDYHGESLIRLIALVCFDGLLPLGPNFIKLAPSGAIDLKLNDLTMSLAFQSIKDTIPGNDEVEKLKFIIHSFSYVSGFLSHLVASNRLTQSGVFAFSQAFTGIREYNPDYLAMYLDASTNYFGHTGTQTVARRLIECATTLV
jgi:hypothetical protein